MINLEFMWVILNAVIFGVIEGVTEWLPISSTGHIILFEDLLSLKATSEFMEVFRVVIQLGSILAVLIVFWNKIWPFYIKKLSTRKERLAHAKEKNEDGIKIFGNVYISKEVLIMWIKIVVACLPAALIGILYDDFFNKYFYNKVSVAVALIVVGIAFILVENWNKKRPEARIQTIKDITFKTAIIIGLFQVLAAMFPGVSRSGATIIGALLIGVSRKTAAEFTFFLAVPVMFGASLLKIVKYDGSFTAAQIFILLVGMISALLVSLVAIKFLMKFIKKHDFKPFGYYRILLGAIILGVTFLA